MIFFNRHLKIGKEIGKATRKSIILPFVVYGKDQNFVPPPEFLTDMYIYGYITGSIGQMIDYAFGGKNWNKQKKGECIMEALKVVDPTEFLLMFHVENVEGTKPSVALKGIDQAKISNINNPNAKTAIYNQVLDTYFPGAEELYNGKCTSYFW